MSYSLFEMQYYRDKEDDCTILYLVLLKMDNSQ